MRNFDFSAATSVANLFHLSQFDNFSFPSSIDLSHLVDATALFGFIKVTNNFDISNLNLSSATKLDMMFQYAEIPYLDLRSLDLSNVTSMIDFLSHFKGSVDINGWVIPAGTNLLRFTNPGNPNIKFYCEPGSALETRLGITCNSYDPIE